MDQFSLALRQKEESQRGRADVCPDVAERSDGARAETAALMWTVADQRAHDNLADRLPSV